MQTRKNEINSNSKDINPSTELEDTQGFSHPTIDLQESNAHKSDAQRYRELLEKHEKLKKEMNVISRSFEEEIHKRVKTEKSLIKERRSLRQIIDINPNLIFAKNRLGQFTLANQALGEAFNVSPEDLIGKTDADFNPNKKEVDHFRADDMRVMDSQEQIVINEEKLTDAKGRIRWLKTVKRAIVDEDGKSNQILGVATDITAQKLYENKLEEIVNKRTSALKLYQERVRAAERMAALGALATGIAHEINTPIGSMLLAAENALDASVNTDDPSELKDINRRICERVQSNAGRCSIIIKQALKVARKERTPRHLHCANDIVQTAYSVIKNFEFPKIGNFKFELSENLPKIFVNRIEFEHLILNLLKNGIYSSSSEVTVVVSTKISGEGKLEIKISDNGDGMTEKVQEKAFEPFFTTKQKSGGSGLGLSIAKSIVKSHRGEIFLNSSPGIGTSVRVILPTESRQKV